jgi:hypothetical protein
MGFTKEQVDKLRDTYKRIRVVETPAGTVIVRAPNRQEWRKFKTFSISDDENQNAVAQENLVLDIVVSHTREEFAALLDVYPGLDSYKPLSVAIKELTGQVESTEGKG